MKSHFQGRPDFKAIPYSAAEKAANAAEVLEENIAALADYEAQKAEALKDTAELGKVLVAESASEGLIEAMRNLYKMIKSQGPQVWIDFNGKRISYQGTVLPSLERRGLRSDAIEKEAAAPKARICTMATYFGLSAAEKKLAVLVGPNDPRLQGGLR